MSNIFRTLSNGVFSACKHGLINRRSRFVQSVRFRITVFKIFIRGGISLDIGLANCFYGNVYKCIYNAIPPQMKILEYVYFHLMFFSIFTYQKLCICHKKLAM